MGARTGIEWTDSTWNPFIGCSRVSEGCRHCYAERLAGRFSAGTDGVYAGTTKAVNGLQVWTGKINRAPEETLLRPLHWRAPRLIFVNSMSDLFHENVPDEWIDQAFAVMALCPQHVFQALTKRSERMLAYLGRFATGSEWANHLSELVDEDDIPLFGEDTECEIANAINGTLGDGYNVGWPMKHVWLGVSVENQKAAEDRIPLLLQAPAAVRFIAAEPLLGLVSLAQWGDEGLECECGWRGLEREALADDSDPDDSAFSCPQCGEACAHTPLNERLGEGIDWVICGGESGAGARPMNPDWARSLRDQCQAAGVPFFFKQWGEFAPGPHPNDPAMEIPIHCSTGGFMHHADKKAAGALLDGREWKEFPTERTTNVHAKE